MATVLVLNGPNLNLLGRREPEVYGTTTLDELMTDLTRIAEGLGTSIAHFQSNVEGELIERIQQAMDDETQCLLINPGAFTHTSIAIRDALLALDKPFIEVHISNVFAREEFRKHSYLSDIATAVITGAGKQCYEMGLRVAVGQLIKN